MKPGPDAAGPQNPEGPVIPSFDVVRVEPSGESVIAGRAAPGATVDLLSNGGALARAMADPSGLFAFVPPRLPTGTHEILLQTIAPDGTRARSAQSVTIAIAEKRDTPPLVAVTTPGQPTVILSQPEDGAKPAGDKVPPAAVASAVPAPSGPATAPLASGAVPPATPGPGPKPERQEPSDQAAAGSPSPSASPAQPARRPNVKIASVEAEGTGRLFVSGSAAPGATLRLYLNDSFVAPGGTRPDGNLSFTIERGVRPGDYQVRLDDVDPVSGNVKSRAEVAFAVPAPTLVASADTPSTTAPPVVAGEAGARRPAPPPASTARAFPPAPVGPDERSTSAASPAFAPPATATGASPAAPDRQSPAGFASRQAEIGSVIVPEVNTAQVSRGDNLWQISKRAYGNGLRYTVIYGANLPQIRNPSLIYPGQVFVLPTSKSQVSR